MALTVAQRIERLRVRLEELACWRDRDYRDLDEWEFDGRPLALGRPWPTTHGTVHLSHPAITVPAGWAIADTVLEFAPGGEGLLTIHYDSGSPDTWALDPYHQRFPLRQSRFSLAADAVARLPFGVPNRAARLEAARLVLVDPTVTYFFRQLEVVIQTAAVLLEAEVTPLLVAAAERAFALLDWPSATDAYLARVQGTQQMLNIWELPAGLDQHPPGLTDTEEAGVRTAASQLERDLKNVLSRYPKHGALALSGHAHLDLAWLWPMVETRRKAQRTFHTAIGLMERYPKFMFNQSTAQVYAFLDEDDPKLLAAIKDRVASGQWEPVGGMWVEPDTNMPAGESLVRQLLYGQRYFKRTFGAAHTVGWMPDCFGFCPQLPQLLRGAGIDSFFTIKLNWSETNRFPYDLFWWQALDGSRVLAHMFDNPTSPFGDPPGIGGYNGDPTPFAAVNTWANYRGKYLFPESLFTIGYGDGGGGPTAEMLERVAETNSLPTIPSMDFTSIHEFFRRAHEAVRNQDVPTWTGEMYLELHRGTLTTQGRTKYLHRRAERDLVAAETLGAMVALCGGDFPESLEDQWHLVLRNEFHDILPGSSIGEVYEVTNAELKSVVERAATVSDAALGTLATSLSPDGDRPALLLVNPDIAARPLRVQLDDEFPGAQSVEGGSVLAGREMVPGLGASIIMRPTPARNLSVSASHLENEYLRVTIAPDGGVTSIWDKRANREALAGPGNQIWAYVDKPRAWDAWDIDAGYADQGQVLPATQAIDVVESGPHRVAVRVQRAFRSSRIVQDIRLWANSPRLEFVTTIDWHDRHWLLKARFPLAVRSERATCDVAFGVVERPTHNNTSWEQARFEVVAHRFVDLGDSGYGVALLNDGKYGHDLAGNVIGLSLLRSPTYPDPLADEGVQTFTYALYPHAGNWVEGGVQMEAEDLNRPLFARKVTAAAERSWQPLAVTGPPLGLGALKVREDGGGLVLRVYEPQGAAGTVELQPPDGWEVASELDLLEDEIAKPGFEFTPFKLRSWLLTR